MCCCGLPLSTAAHRLIRPSVHHRATDPENRSWLGSHGWDEGLTPDVAGWMGKVSGSQLEPSPTQDHSIPRWVSSQMLRNPLTPTFILELEVYVCSDLEGLSKFDFIPVNAKPDYMKRCWLSQGHARLSDLTYHWKVLFLFCLIWWHINCGM